MGSQKLANTTTTERAEKALDAGARRLRFPREFEQVFRSKYYRESIVSIRVAMGLGLAIYLLFGLVDRSIPMPQRLYAEVIRYGIVGPCMALVLLLSFHNFFSKIYSPMFGFVMLLVGCGVVSTNALHEAPSAWYQQTSLMLVLLFSYIFVRMQFLQTIFIGLAITAVSLVVSWFYTKTPTSLYLYTALCLISANIFGMFAAYLIEFYERRHFLQERRRDMEKLKFKRLSDELRSSTNRDQLTGIANRYCFETALEEAYERAVLKNRELSVFLVDVDNFKEFNDTVGHREGDRCLIAIAKTLANMPHRPGDMVARHSGAEFAILLPKTDAKTARELIEPLIKSVEALGIRKDDSTDGEFITVTAGGVTTQPQIGGHGSMLLDESRAMLKRARQQGRNRVVMNIDAGDAADIRADIKAEASVEERRSQITLLKS